MVPRRRWAHKQARRHAGTQGHRNADTQERERAGTQARMHAGTQAGGHASAQAHKHAGTRARRHGGTPARRHASRQASKQANTATPTLRKRSKTAPQKIEQSLVLQKGSQPVPGRGSRFNERGVLAGVYPVRRGLGFKVPQPRTPHAESPRHGDWKVHPEAVSCQLRHLCHIASHVFRKSVPADVISLAFPRAPSCLGVLGSPPRQRCHRPP